MSDPEISTPQDPRRVATIFDELLKSPVSTLRRVRADGRLYQTWILAAGATLAFALYGLVAGSFQGAPQMAIAAWKAPAIIALSALLCAPSLFVFGSLLGASLTPRTLFTVLVGFCAFLGVLLVGLVPIVWLFSASSRSLVFVTWLHVFLWFAAVTLAGRYLRTVLGEAGGRGIIVPWLVLFTVVSFQVVTLLRPVLWRESDEPLLESRTEKLSFFEHLGTVYDFGLPKPRVLPDRPTAIKQVLDAERARSADTARDGVAGLLRHVADDGLTFTPTPLRAKAAWSADPAASPAAPGTTRDVRIGDVSESRDLAWLLAAAETRTADGGSRRGCVLSIWRQVEAGWRLVLDAEVSMPDGCRFERPGFTPADDSMTSSTPWRTDPLEALKQADLRVARLTGEKDLTTGLGSVLREDVRIYRPGQAAIIWRDRAREYLAADREGRTQFTQFGAVTSRDGSIGYTYGRAERTTASSVDTQYYVRIWRAWPGGDYAVVVDAQTAAR